MSLTTRDLDNLQRSWRIEDRVCEKIANDLFYTKKANPDDFIMLEMMALVQRHYFWKGAPDQPRVPAGEAGGGQWTSGGDHVSGGDGNNTPGMGHNRPPVIVKPTKVPMGPMLPAMLDHVFNRNRLPQERQDAVNDTLSHINNGTVPEGLGHKWGDEFKNEDRVLPEIGVGGFKDPITYKEYKVAPPPNEYNIGTWRIVQGSDGSTYLTGSHYGRRQDGKQERPFVRIK
jgi:hypothetical protein